MQTKITNIGRALLCVAVTALAQHALWAAAPNIASAAVNAATNRITILGTNLAPASGAPTVTLDNIALTLINYNSTSIVANMPPSLGAATYNLSVTVAGSTAVFDVALGAIGPAGPQGPTGPQGPAGLLTLPFFAAAPNSSGPVLAIANGGSGSLASGIGGYGASALPVTPGSVNTSGGPGVFGGGGQANGGGVAVSLAGPGVDGLGGPGYYSTDFAGPGGYFAGGYGGAGYGGDGIDVYPGQGGNGPGFGIYSLCYGCYAGYFDGNVTVVGNFSKSSGTFQIDHPLDPANKYLYHSFVESPDMMNVYNGNVTTDGSGYALVTLPDWFEALNRDFRYQLTVIGQFAQAMVQSEVQNNSFAIKTDKPGVKVSWQVTGIRQDAWANAHRIQVEADKPADERGHYLHPELFGHADEPGIAQLRHPAPKQSQPVPQQ